MLSYNLVFTVLFNEFKIWMFFRRKHTCKYRKENCLDFLSNTWNSWEAAASSIQGLIAKEQVISSMSIIAKLNTKEAGQMIFNTQSFSFFNPINAYSFMIFNLFCAPCFGAISAMQKEFGSTKKAIKAILFQTGIAWVMATLFFNIGTFMTNL